MSSIKIFKNNKTFTCAATWLGNLRLFQFFSLYFSLSLDYIVLGSDSGRIVIIEYDPVKNVFEKVHQETYGKSGCRRIVPGQYLAVDPKGRALMIGEWVESHHIHNHANGEAVLLIRKSSKIKCT